MTEDSPLGAASGRGIPVDLAERVRLVVFDVDGVLTDGGAYIGQTADGRAVELKRFDIQDGLGIKLLVDAGLEVALISGRLSHATSLRARELGIEECHQDAGAQKLPILRALLQRKGLEWGEVAMLADDLPDMALLRRVGLPAAVANAVPEIDQIAVWRARRRGGHGAAREFCRALLVARGQWEQQVEAYCRAREGES